MAAYCHMVYDSRHLQADCYDQLRNPIRSVIEYGLPFPFYIYRTDLRQIYRVDTGRTMAV